MGKTTGFLEHSRENFASRHIAERIGDYREVMKILSNDKVSIQASRCMDCGIPFCHATGCPLHNLIPEWNDLVYRGKWKEAALRLERTNNFPEITGRVCPAPCETACTLSINDSPVTIKQIELAVIENAFKFGWIVPRPPQRETGKKIAVIGSGPAGLAAAQQLRRRGHQVTVFERSGKAGGILRYGIPDFKLEKWVIDRRLDQMKAEGVRFETEVVIGEDISARYLRKSFDVILLTVGAGEPRDLDIPGRGLEGVYFAMEYLTRSNEAVNGEAPLPEAFSARDRSVLVIGGGDTGSDCVGTANRQKAKRVTQFEILDKPLEWKEPWNPSWPEWPLVLRTSSSHEEGVERQWGVLTESFVGSDRVEGVCCSRVRWVAPSPSERPVMEKIPGSEFRIDAELVLLAMGFLHPEHGRLVKELGVRCNARGNIETDPGGGYATSVKRVFAAGDADTGASLVVRAIRHGREAAEEIDAYLKNA